MFILRSVLLITMMLLVACGDTHHRDRDSNEVFNDSRGVTKDEARASAVELLSLVRFYYPSEEVKNADWDRVQAYVMRRVDQAITRGELARAFSESLHPLAPALSIDGYRAKPLAPDTGEYAAWLYNGSYVAKDWDQCAIDLGLPRGGAIYQTQIRITADKKEQYFPAQSSFKVTLRAGIEIELPTILTAQYRNALPEGDALSAVIDNESIAAGSPYANLSAAATIWATFRHFFPYQAEMKVDFDRSLIPLLNEAEKASNKDELITALRRFTAQFQDGHNFYLPRRGGGESGTLTDVIDTDWIDDQVVVTWLAPDYKGPLQIGDVVTTFQGKTIADYFADILPLMPLAPEKRKQYLAKFWLYREGNTIDFSVRHADGSEQAVTMQMHPMTAEVEQRLRERTAFVVREVEPGIFVINERAPMAVADVLRQVKNAKAVILDSRPGDEHDNWELAAGFLATGLTSQKYQQQHQTLPWQTGLINELVSWQQPPPSDINNAKLIVIMNRHTQSSGETWLNLFKGVHHGTLVGEATHGANGNITCAQVLGGSRNSGISVFYTGLHVANLDGSQHHAIGTLPDVEVKQTLQDVRSGRDALMEKALELARAP